MKKLMLTVCLVACAPRDVSVPPDATMVDPDASADATVDASPDAPPDADPCWTHRYPQCGNEIYDLCVPYSGCATWTCEGQTYGYCGPGGL